MNKPLKMSSIALATLAAGLFAVNGPVTAQSNGASAETVHCLGVNACKGMSSCQTATSSCAGQNSCKGKGYVEMSKKACQQIGGKVEKSGSSS